MIKGRILVVDNEIRICKVLEDFLCKRGYDVKIFYTGTEAIKLLKNKQFDLLLCRYIMPKVSGHDIVNSLDLLQKRPKVGLITIWGEMDETNLKADFIVRKPIDFLELTRHIKDVISEV